MLVGKQAAVHLALAFRLLRHLAVWLSLASPDANAAQPLFPPLLSSLSSLLLQRALCMLPGTGRRPWLSSAPLH